MADTVELPAPDETQRTCSAGRAWVVGSRVARGRKVRAECQSPPEARRTEEHDLSAYPPGANGNGAPIPSHRAITPMGAWRLAGLLFITGALSTIPGTFLLESDFEPWMYGLTALAVALGVACLVLPWWRIPDRTLLAVPVVATILIAIAVGITHEVFTYLYFFVALFVALVFPEPRRMAAVHGARRACPLRSARLLG